MLFHQPELVFVWEVFQYFNRWYIKYTEIVDLGQNVHNFKTATVKK
jgi:hypothetical protein